MGQIGEQGLNLSESWHRGHSYTYNTPFCSKSSAKDLLHSIFELAFGRTSPATRFAPGQSRDPVMIWGAPEDALCVCAMLHRVHTVSPPFSMDSGLEAFSLNPTHGSFSALTFQSTEMANYADQRFLSY